jgi:hypothetical protein
MKKIAWSLVAVSGLLASVANAQIVTLEDGNSLTRFDPDTADGQFAWEVSGVNHMFQQWFWLRAGADTAERDLSTLVKIAQTVTDTNPLEDPRPDTLNLGYREPGAARYEVFGTFTLRGGAPGQTLSDIAETLTIRNISQQPLTFSFFQYADFDINDTSGGDTGQILIGRIPQQFEGGAFATEAVVTSAPNAWQIATFPTIINSLTDNAITNLNNASGPVGPGDLSWALQWNFTLGPGQEFLISKDKQIIPAPGAFGLLAAAGVFAGRRRRR